MDSSKPEAFLLSEHGLQPVNLALFQDIEKLTVLKAGSLFQRVLSAIKSHSSFQSPASPTVTTMRRACVR